MSRLSAILAAFSLLLLSAVGSAQSQSTLYADTSCNSNLCLRVIYDSAEKKYDMTMSANGGGAPMGWYAVGTGKQMDGSNMMIGWVDTNGKVVMSQRTATGHVDPTTRISAASATLDTQRSSSNSSGTVWRWSFPLSSSDGTPSKSTSFIWAVNKKNNPSSSPSSSIARHTSYGTLSLDLTKPYSATSSSSGNSGSNSNTPVTPATGQQVNTTRAMNMSNKLIIAHMVMMIVAWFLLVPAAILIGRFGRTFFTWFPVHRNIQIAAAVVVLIGFILIVVEVGQGGDGHFTSNHGKAGLAIFIILFIQIILGAVGHKTKRFNPSRIVHVVLGLGLTVAAIWNSIEGLSLWQWGVPRWASWILWIWAAVLAVAYLAGLALLPRDLRQWKAAKNGTTEEKQEYLGLHKPASGHTTNENSSQAHTPPTDQPQMHPGWGAPPLQSRGYQSYGHQQAHLTGDNRV